MTIWVFLKIHSVAKHQKIKGLTMSKKIKGGTLQSLPVLYVTRKKRKNLFGSVR